MCNNDFLMCAHYVIKRTVYSIKYQVYNNLWYLRLKFREKFSFEMDKFMLKNLFLKREWLIIIQYDNIIEINSNS